MTVDVHLLTQAHPVVLCDVKNAYQKGTLYCVMLNDAIVHKFPIEHIFRIIERPS